MSTVKPDDLTLADAAEQIKMRQLRPVDLSQRFLKRLAELNPSINAFLTVDERRVLGQAKEAEDLISRGKYLGPLHGIPIAVKDLFETAGLRTTGGSKILANYIPTRDAHVVRRLREQGAVIIGKTNLHEWAVGATNINPHFGACHNPWDLKRVPGGSSGGSAAAVAARMCLGAVGTDTGGSIRIPASACGVVGLKPTHGLVSLTGVMPFSWSMDHAGPIALTVEDCALILDAIVGYDPVDPESTPSPTPECFHDSINRPIEDLRVAVPKNYFFDSINADVHLAVLEAVKTFEKRGAHIYEASFPGVEEDVKAGGFVRLAEGATVHYREIAERRSEIGPDVLERLEVGLHVSMTEYVLARRTQESKVRMRARFFEEFDLLVTPTIPIEPPLIAGTDSIQVAAELTRLTVPFNFAGLPAISIPCGFSRNGLPIGLQLVAGHWKESILLTAAHVYEAATEWKNKRPHGLRHD